MKHPSVPKWEAKKFRKSKIINFLGGKEISGSQARKRTECLQSAGPVGAERRVPLRNSILFHIFSRQFFRTVGWRGLPGKRSWAPKSSTSPLQQRKTSLPILCPCTPTFSRGIIPMEEELHDFPPCAASPSLCERQWSTGDQISISNLLPCWTPEKWQAGSKSSFILTAYRNTGVFQAARQMTSKNEFHTQSIRR